MDEQTNEWKLVVVELPSPFATKSRRTYVEQLFSLNYTTLQTIELTRPCPRLEF